MLRSVSVVGLFLVLVSDAARLPAEPADKHQKRVANASVPKESPEDPKDFVIRSTSRLVLLDVSVRDRDKALVSGLTKDDFRVFEDGKPQTISQFANVDIPVTVGIVVDESGSMAPKRREAITAALVFASESNPKDEMFVLSFNEKVSRGLPDTVLFTDSVPLLRKALLSGVAEGRTALYDAIVASLKQLEWGRRDKKTAILISDGGDNVSTNKLKDVIALTESTVATIYTIGIFEPDDPDKNPGLLSHLAKISGGIAYFPDKLEDIVPICRQIAKDIRTRYTIGYIPEAGKGKTQLRHIRVEASFPDRGKLTVRARTSYLYADDRSGGTEAIKR